MSRASKKEYANLFWSRIISLQSYRPNENERWPMQPDIDLEKEIFEEMEFEGEPDWKPIFDPKVFC